MKRPYNYHWTVLLFCVILAARVAPASSRDAAHCVHGLGAEIGAKYLHSASAEAIDCSHSQSAEMRRHIGSGRTWSLVQCTKVVLRIRGGGDNDDYYQVRARMRTHAFICH